MSKQSALNIKKLLSSLYCLGITSVFILTFWFTGFFSYFDTAIYDFLLNVKISYKPQALNPQIIPVDLNDRSEMILGSRIDDRSAFGDLFFVLQHSGVSVTALDFIYHGEREKDAVLLDAAAGMGPVAIAVVPVPEGRENSSYRELDAEETHLLRRHLWRPKEFGAGNIPRAGTFIMPFNKLSERSTQLAHIGVEPDHDGIYRRMPLFYAWEDGFIPAISLAAALLELGVDGNDIEIHYGKEVLIPLEPDEFISIPIDSSGVVVVPFRGKWTDTTHRYSFDALADARHNEEELNDIRSDILGSLCFVADTTFIKKDIGPVPCEEVYPLSGLHTWVISSILDASMGENTFFRENSRLYRFICIVLIAFLFIFLGMFKKDSVFNIGSIILFLTFTGITMYLWFIMRFIPWYTLGAAAIILPWLLGLINRFLGQRRMQTAMERYVPRPVAQRLVTGNRISLIPVHKELTILFTDIKGFTSWSSGREAMDVHDFLNDYLESMANILFDHGATVDKFMGDGILAFFGDPLEMDNHAEQAIKAAIAMQEKIKALGEKWKPLVGIDLKVRMGINTGEVIVGDLGTKSRIEYTVIGSTVNLAQRMESNALPGGILVSDSTREAYENTAARKKRAAPAKNTLPVPFTFRKKIVQALKGYERSIVAHEVMF
ncbi:MAG: CHASE2 domain-containing protein [Treponema sp.]|nr:CHASE2 domain-containing protein [Treponema sp.]